MEMGGMKTNEEYRLLEQQLVKWQESSANAAGEALALSPERDKLRKQNMLLRDALHFLMKCKQGEFCDNYVDAERKAKEALDATADLAGLVVCDAEPVGYVTSDGFYAGYNKDDAVGTYIYKAKEKS
jgi:hypothetical protein